MNNYTQICINCGSPDFNRGKIFCSNKCSQQAQANHTSQYMKEKWSTGQIKGTTGMSFSKSTKRKMSEAHKQEKAYNWKDEKASYSAKHTWIAKHWGKAEKCENVFCSGESNSYQWANIDGMYSRQSKNGWKQLCASCHKKVDTFNYEFKTIN